MRSKEREQHVFPFKRMVTSPCLRPGISAGTVDLNAADLALYAEANERLTAALAAANAAD